MMKKSILLGVLLGTIFTAADTACAEFFNGILLNRYCYSESGYEQGMCLGYIVGVIDSFNTTHALKEAGNVICIPPPVTSGQLVLVLKKSMQEHPESLHLPASAYTLGALTRAFPCP